MTATTTPDLMHVLLHRPDSRSQWQEIYADRDPAKVWDWFCEFRSSGDFRVSTRQARGKERMAVEEGLSDG